MDEENKEAVELNENELTQDMNEELSNGKGGEE